MEIQKYIDHKIELEDSILEFLDEENSDDDFLYYILPDETLSDQEYREKLRLLLYLISKICNNHRRYNGFFDKITKIFLRIKNEIKQTFSNQEIFNIFKSNKRVILILFETQIITADETIVKLIMTKSDPNSFKINLFKPKGKNDTKYCHYFYPEIKNFIDESKRKTIENEIFKSNPKNFDVFERKRKIGENDSCICEFIRNDSVTEFISYVNKNLLPRSTKIKPSIYETNPFLINKEPSLIKYAAFYGSIQIFQYLKMNGIKMKKSLWLYAIHGNKPEIIHLIEENQIQPKDKTFIECYEEAIKCHHNDLAKYINENLMNHSIDFFNSKYNLDENPLSFCFHYNNYACFPEEFNNDLILFYLSKYNYYILVKLFVNSKEINVNRKKVNNFVCFKITFHKSFYIHIILHQNLFLWNSKTKHLY